MGSKNHPNYKLFPVANLRHQLSSYSQIILIYFPSDALQFLGKLTPLIKVCWPCWFLHHTGVFPLRDLRGGSGVTDVKWTFFQALVRKLNACGKLTLKFVLHYKFPTLEWLLHICSTTTDRWNRFLLLQLDGKNVGNRKSYFAGKGLFDLKIATFYQLSDIKCIAWHSFSSCLDLLIITFPSISL